MVRQGAPYASTDSTGAKAPTTFAAVLMETRGEGAKATKETEDSLAVPGATAHARDCPSMPLPFRG